MFRIWLCLMAVFFSLAPQAAPAQSEPSDFRSRVDRETDPVRKARLIRQLQPAKFKEISKAFDASQLNDALAMLMEFTAEAQSCENDLETKQANAEAHPAGFKDLQIGVREALRGMDDMLVTITSDQQPPFRAVHGQLNDLDLRLIHVLFPTPKRAEKAEKKGNK